MSGVFLWLLDFLPNHAAKRIKTDPKQNAAAKLGKILDSATDPSLDIAPGPMPSRPKTENDPINRKSMRPIAVLSAETTRIRKPLLRKMINEAIKPKSGTTAIAYHKHAPKLSNVALFNISKAITSLFLNLPPCYPRFHLLNQPLQSLAPRCHARSSGR